MGVGVGVGVGEEEKRGGWADNTRELMINGYQ